MHEVGEAGLAFELLDIGVVPGGVRVHADEEFVSLSGCCAKECSKISDERFSRFPRLCVVGSHKGSALSGSDGTGFRSARVLADSVRRDYGESGGWGHQVHCDPPTVDIFVNLLQPSCHVRLEPCAVASFFEDRVVVVFLERMVLDEFALGRDVICYS